MMRTCYVHIMGFAGTFEEVRGIAGTAMAADTPIAAVADREGTAPLYSIGDRCIPTTLSPAGGPAPACRRSRTCATRMPARNPQGPRRQAESFRPR